MNINSMKTKPNHYSTPTAHSIGVGALLLALGLSATPAMAESLNCSQTPKINADPKINCFSPNTPALSGEVNANIERLLQRIAVLEAKLEKVYYNPVSNILYIKGTNLQIINGEDATETTNGTGNLIIGYNKPATREVCSNGSGLLEYLCDTGTWAANQRTGSHNLVIGDMNQYTQFGGIVAGLDNAIVNHYASVSGGVLNTAAGKFASVSGGGHNVAEGENASISGGYKNYATGVSSSISGGYLNQANGVDSSISGGQENDTWYTALRSSISGGFNNHAVGSWSSVYGGQNHYASDDYSVKP